MANQLSVSDVVNVSVSLTPTVASTLNFNTLLIMGSSPVIDVSQRVRVYSTTSQVASDFGSLAPEYLAAVAYFSQSPQPGQLYIGRWAQNGAAAVLHGQPLGNAATALAALQAVTNGALSYAYDGVITPTAVKNINLSSAVTLQGIAATLTTSVGSHLTFTYNSVYNRFDVISTTAGLASAVAVTVDSADVASGSTNLLSLLGLSTGTAYVPGLAPETPAQAVQQCAIVSNAWYGVTFAATAETLGQVATLAVANIVEGLSPAHLFGITTSDPNATVSTATTDIAYLLASGTLTRSFSVYSSSSAYAAAALFGVMFGVNFLGNNTTITLKFKQLLGIAPESLTETQAASLNVKNCNVYVTYNNGASITQQGVMCSGTFIDEIQGGDWFGNAIQTAIFNVLQTLPKVPQTDPGIAILAAATAQQCQQAVANGFLAPGVWEGPNIGAIVTNEYLASGFYVYVPSINNQALAQRAARAAPVMQVCAKQAGAVHSANILVSVEI